MMELRIVRTFLTQHIGAREVRTTLVMHAGRRSACNNGPTHGHALVQRQCQPSVSAGAGALASCSNQNQTW